MAGTSQSATVAAIHFEREGTEREAAVCGHEPAPGESHAKLPYLFVSYTFGDQRIPWRQTDRSNSCAGDAAHENAREGRIDQFESDRFVGDQCIGSPRKPWAPMGGIAT